MQTISLKDARARGTELYEQIGGDDGWDWDGCLIFRVGRKYAYFTDSGCSCYGAWENDEETSMLVTAKELRKIAEKWVSNNAGYLTEREAGEWVLANIGVKGAKNDVSA